MCSQAKSHPEDRLLLPFVRSPNWSIFQPWSLPLGALTVAAQRQKLQSDQAHSTGMSLCSAMILRSSLKWLVISWIYCTPSLLQLRELSICLRKF